MQLAEDSDDRSVAEKSIFEENATLPQQPVVSTTIPDAAPEPTPVPAPKTYAEVAVQATSATTPAKRVKEKEEASKVVQVL